MEKEVLEREREFLEVEKVSICKWYIFYNYFCGWFLFKVYMWKGIFEKIF